MAKILGRPAVVLTATLELTKHELGALDALAGYGTDAFLKVFYEKMGKAYLEPHERGLRSLFESVRKTVPRLESLAKDAEDVFNGVKTAYETRWVTHEVSELRACIEEGHDYDDDQKCKRCGYCKPEDDATTKE